MNTTCLYEPAAGNSIGYTYGKHILIFARHRLILCVQWNHVLMLTRNFGCRLKWNQPMAEDLADRRKRFKRATSTRVTLTNGEPLTGHRVTWPLTDDAAMVSKRATSGTISAHTVNRYTIQLLPYIT